VHVIGLQELLEEMGRPRIEEKQLDLLNDARIHYAGDLDVLKKKSVSIVGTRNVTHAGASRANKLAKQLVAADVTVVSGLAKGVDRVALSGAIDVGGRTAAVIGTPIDKAYPAENAELHTLIYQKHLLLTPFAIGEATYRSNFPKRNRVMAAITDATVIVEASDTSGTLHQAKECGRLNRWLFIMKSVVDDSSLHWPKRFLGDANVRVLSDTAELLEALNGPP
jgi:DNA processing protein